LLLLLLLFTVAINSCVITVELVIFILINYICPRNFLNSDEYKRHEKLGSIKTSTHLETVCCMYWPLTQQRTEQESNPLPTIAKDVIMYTSLSVTGLIH